MKELLPIGSVVLLKDGKKRLMVCGRIQRKVGEEKCYDYCACLFPEGIVSAKDLFLFNNEDIDRVYFVGLQDEEEFRFRGFMEQRLKELGLDGSEG